MAGDMQSADTAAPAEAVSAPPSGASAARPFVHRLSRFLHILPRRYDAVRMVLGFLLLSAAALKTDQLATEPILETGLFASRWFQVGLVEFELLFGLILVTGIFRRAAWVTAILLFAALATVSLTKGLSGAASCGCFGKLQISPWITFSVNLAAFVSLLLWKPASSTDVRFGSVHNVASSRPVIAAAFLLFGLPAAVAMMPFSPTVVSEDGIIVGDGNVVLLEPEKWIGKRFPLLRFLNAGGNQCNNTGIVVLYRRSCAECQSVISRLSRGGDSRNPADVITLIELPPASADPPIALIPNYDSVRLDDARQWLAKVPVVIDLRDGIVLSVHRPRHNSK